MHELNSGHSSRTRSSLLYSKAFAAYCSHALSASIWPICERCVGWTADLLTISKLLGHADTRITSKHYAHLADKTLAAAITKLPSFSSPTQAGESLGAVG